jgi:HlyD family secretion protein
VSPLGVAEQRVNVVIALRDPAQAAALGLGDGVSCRSAHPGLGAIRRGEGAHQQPVPSRDGWAVFVIDGKRARRRPVEVGQRTDLEAQIIAGLQSGDRVVVYPS